MKNVIYTLGIRRSGNSPIRNWVSDQFPNSRTFLNAAQTILTQLESVKEDSVIVSFEEMPVEVFNDNEHKKVLMLRDPANLWASRIKHYDALSSKKRYISPMVTNLWLNHAKKFLKPGDVIPVNHQTFLTDVDYRKELGKKLGATKFCDCTLDRVDDNGQGSSFDGLDYDGNATEMPVFERWKEYADLQCFRDLFTDEVKELAVTIYGERPWTELFS